eukprot:CAMPEP_0206187098 /NCGR_PEP_ID=MMETSP0166-20121206/2797_1 /ASSEMBLY_ACC=CAM_ASM_000260 /TAXON_ID=95228 /ORGANISM="Vannella robusta, Strain DIVA3 518/3/11/1/6" /LENGTH=206 /DNA_ID=CAMNT_0053602611 /DNA_START=61 /DNA_END=677 /DNA_ORIENTATION=-
MKAGENRFHPEFMDELNQLFDLIESSTNAAALVITGQAKFFSNGLDIDFLMTNHESASAYLSNYQKILSRLISLNLPTVAAINGHAFAGGCMFALACDFRLMREDRGFMCLPEVDLGFDLSPGMTALIKEKITNPQGIRDMILLGIRADSKQCVQMGIVDKALPLDSLVPEAIKFAESIAGKSVKREAFGILKSSTYSHVLEALAT